MSIKLMTAVWESSLPADLKFVALCLADFASDSGDSIFPSKREIARKCSKSERAIHYSLRKLEDAGIITAVAGHGGGRGTNYRFYVERLPYEGDRNPATIARLPVANPVAKSATFDTQVCNERHLSLQPIADDPSEPPDPSDPEDRELSFSPGGCRPPDPPPEPSPSKHNGNTQSINGSSSTPKRKQTGGLAAAGAGRGRVLDEEEEGRLGRVRLNGEPVRSKRRSMFR